MSQFEVGDIVVYDPPNREAADYAKPYLNCVGVVTNEGARGSRPTHVDETNVNWISGTNLANNPCRHFTKNLRKLGHVTVEADGAV